MTVFYLLSFVLGTCAGSFVQCVTERRLKGLPIGGRSRCDSCGAVFQDGPDNAWGRGDCEAH